VKIFSSEKSGFPQNHQMAVRATPQKENKQKTQRTRPQCLGGIDNKDEMTECERTTRPQETRRSARRRHSRKRISIQSLMPDSRKSGATSISAVFTRSTTLLEPTVEKMYISTKKSKNQCNSGTIGSWMLVSCTAIAWTI